MKEFFQFALLGLGLAAIYALLSDGIVRIYQGSGVVNFAQGAFALVGAIVYAETANSGLPEGLALVLATLAGVALGLGTQLLIMRPLADAAPITKLIATLGLLIVIQSAAALHYGAVAVSVGGVLPDRLVHIFGLSVQADRLILFGIAIAITVALTAIDRWTVVGLATRAAAADERAASTLGWSPGRLAAANWTIGGALAGFAGALIVPLTGLQVATLTLLIIPALAASLLARFDSFPLALLGATVIGVGQSLIGRYVTQSGAADAFPFLLIIIVLVVTGQSLPLRGHVADRLPTIGNGILRPKLLVPAAAVGIVLMSAVFSTTWQDAFTVSLSLAVVALSVVVVTGYAGQVSLAQYTMGGLGAYVAGRLVAAEGWPFWLAAAAGVLAAIPIGLAFALPALRTRGVNLSVVTLGLAVAVSALLFQNTKYTGGFEGTNVGATKLFGLPVDSLGHPGRWGVLVLVAFLVCAIVVANLRRSTVGRRMIAIRENERAAASMGISVVRAKLYAFALASAVAAVGGILIAFRNPAVIYSDFDPFKSIYVIAYAVIGGIGYVLSALVGSVLAQGGVGSLLDPLLGGIDKYLALISGVLVIATLIMNPDGLVASVSRLWHKLARRRGRSVRDRRVPEELLVVPDDHPRVEPQTLTVTGLTVRFGEVAAVRDLDLTVRPGEIVGLIGPNGAGKTTFIDAVTGFVRSSGSIRLGDRDLSHASPSRRVSVGLARSWQSLELFEDITVLENMQIASDAASRHRFEGVLELVRPRRVELSGPARMAISEFGLTEDLASKPAELSYGLRRLVAIARATALSPSVLMLDEPAAGLSDGDSKELGTLLRRLADDWGLGILLIEHDVDLVMSLCDRIAVLDFGEKIAEGRPDEIRQDPAVVAAYLGGSDDSLTVTV
jgi:sulfate-transporting ATPase